MAIERMLTVMEVANAIKVSRRTVWNWISEGLPHVKIGKVVRIMEDDLYRWVHERKVVIGKTDHAA